MTRDEFQIQMNRLVQQFGKGQYSEERVKLLWCELEDLDRHWWERTVDKLIGECRQAPLLPEFREEIARERERQWRLEKKEHEQDAKDFFASSYQPDDVRTICQTIIKKIQGGVSDEDYGAFQKMLGNVAKSNPSPMQKINCKQCEDTGLVFHRDQNNYEWVYRCPCPHGASKPAAYPVFQEST